MNVLAFAGSTSRNSINKQFVTFVSHHYFPNEEIQILDLNDYDMPVYGIDREKENGIPGEASLFAEKVEWADIILISLAEHNGSYSAAFKNLFDWASRIPGKTVWQDTPLFVMAVSPGARGGRSVLDTAIARFPFNGGKVAGSFSLPKFKDNFDSDSGRLINEEVLSDLDGAIDGMKQTL